MDRKEILANNLRRLMADQGLRPIDVCKSMKIADSTLSSWMNAKSYPRIQVLQDLTQYFGCDLSDLIEPYGYIPMSYVLTEKEQIIIDVYRKASSDEKFCIEGLVRSIRRENNEESQWNRNDLQD